MDSSSRGFAVVAFQDSTEFALASNATFGLRDEVFIENCVVSTDTPMRPPVVIMIQPDSKDVVQLPSAEADEMSERLALCCPDTALTKRTCFGRPWRNPNASDVRLPEQVEFVRVLSVSAPYEESWFNALILHPH